MDIQLPGLNGFNTTIEIKKHLPELPVIAQTAYAINGDKARCLEAGCDDYISKPIDPSELLFKISRFLDEER